MLAHRVIPTILKNGDKLVKGQRFNGWRSVGHARQAIAIHQTRGVDEIIILDIAATPEGRGPDLEALKSYTDEAFSPVTYGGGIRTLQDIEDVLRSGADKVAIKTAAVKRPKFVTEAAARFGSQAIVVAADIDYERRLTAKYVAKCWALMGAGEIMLTAMYREGTMDGYDLELIASVSDAVDIPVIAHGGCSGYQDMANAIRAGASAVAAGALFQFTDCTPRGAAEYLASQGIEARV